MNDGKKTKDQLIEELVALRRQVAERDDRDVVEQLQKRHRSIARVREVIGGMREGEDMGAVLIAVREELRQLEVPFNSCGVNIVDETDQPASVRYHTMNESGAWVPTAPDHSGAKTVVLIWRGGEVAYRRNLEREDRYGAIRN